MGPREGSSSAKKSSLERTRRASRSSGRTAHSPSTIISTSLVRGILVETNYARWQDVSDGLSQTLLFGEVAGLPLVYGHTDWGEETRDGRGGWAFGNGASLYPVLNGKAALPVIEVYATMAEVLEAPGVIINAENVGTSLNASRNFFSFHPGRVVSAFCDGSVKFLSESVAWPIIGALATRDGGEPIDAKAWQ